MQFRFSADLMSICRADGICGEAGLAVETTNHSIPNRRLAVCGGYSPGHIRLGISNETGPSADHGDREWPHLKDAGGAVVRPKAADWSQSRALEWQGRRWLPLAFLPES